MIHLSVAVISHVIITAISIAYIIIVASILLSMITAVDCSDVHEQEMSQSPRIVNTKYGTIRGIIIPLSLSSSSSGASASPSSSSRPSPSSQMLIPVEAFLGVPYASPPINSLRFMPPVTPTHWRGVRLANRLSPVCPQKIPDISNTTEALKRISTVRLEYLRRVVPYLRNQSEDCLYLNIYVPYHQSSVSSSSEEKSASYKYPIIVFINGESYDWDAGNQYDGSILSSFGHVIIVTLNYRLGILGFLPAMVDGTVRGNYGLMDQVAALHWIQENIHEFGGDGTNVTVIGHSYGAACVHLLMLSPMAKGLFTRVILMSGSALSPWAIAKDSDTHSRYLAKELNCPNYDNVVMVECLRQKSVDDILRVSLLAPQHLSTFGPIVDGIVVPFEPKVMMQNGAIDSTYHYHPLTASAPSGLWGINYDLLFGVTRVESPFIFSAHEERHGIDLTRRDRILRTLVRNLFDFHQQAILLTLINEYTDWSRPSEHPINLLDSTVDILSDALIVAPLMDTGDLFYRWNQYKSSTSSLGSQSQSRTSSSSSSSSSSSETRPKSFFYVFVYQSEDGTKLHQRLGCQHGEELAYLFGAPIAIHLLGRSIGHFGYNYSKPEITLAEAVMTYWVNFAKYGDPNIHHQDADSSSGDGHKKGRFESVVWPQYDVQQRKYLMIGMKPKVRDHYHSHRLSFWLKLIPNLHQPSNDEEIYLRHHLLSDHENIASYDGVVRQIALKFLQPLPTIAPLGVRNNRPFTTESVLITSINPNQHDDNYMETGNSFGGISVINGDDNGDNKTTATAIVMSGSSDGYTTALSVTIAIGCSLLILNMLIFAGVYYQLDRAKSRENLTNRTESISSTTSGHTHHHHELSSHCEPITASSIVHYKNQSSSSPSSPIHTILSSNSCNQTSDSGYHYQSNNTNSLRRHHQQQQQQHSHVHGTHGQMVTTFGKVITHPQLESVPENQPLIPMTSVPSSVQCSKTSTPSRTNSPYKIQHCHDMNHIGSEINI